MASIFSKIIAGEIPSYNVAENENFIAFLDVFPLRRGHVLVVPKEEVDYIFDMQDDALAQLHLFAKNVAIGLKKAIACERIGIAVIGLEVPHVHIHLVPMNSVSDMDFSQPKMKFSNEEFTDTADLIRANIT